jgi:hypothetical protein
VHRAWPTAKAEQLYVLQGDVLRIDSILNLPKFLGSDDVINKAKKESEED